MRVLSRLALLSFAAPCLSQLALPSPPFMPPPAASGTVSSASAAKPNAQWSTLLGNLLYFYEAQRSGKLPSTNRVPWRNSSALDDGKDIDQDLTGGYYDAGDYLKCTFPMTFTLTSLCWGAIEFGTGYDDAKQTPYLDDMLRWGLDWLIKAHPDPESLVVQVGDGRADNSYWGGDQNFPSPRKSFVVNGERPGTDAAASASNAFSMCSILYSGSKSTFANSAPASLTDTKYAATLATHATQLFSLATGSDFKTFTQTFPALKDIYPSSGYIDDLILSAISLGAATNQGSYIKQALDWWKGSELSGGDYVLNWDSKGPAIPVMFAQLASAQPGLLPNSSSLGAWQKEAEGYFDRIINRKGRGYLTNGGLLYYDGDSDSASLNPAMNAAMLMLHYAPLATSTDKKNSYTTFARSQIAYLMGENPTNAPYIVGSSPNAPSNPHSAPASGGSDIRNVNTSPPKMAHVLYGAVVGGPNKMDQFFDIRNDWAQTEVALDYNAPVLTLAAWSVTTESDDPYFARSQHSTNTTSTPSGLPCDATNTCGESSSSGGSGSKGLSEAGKIALAVALGVVGLGTILALSYLCLARRQKEEKTVA